MCEEREREGDDTLTTSPRLYISLNFKPLLESGCGTPRKEDSRRRIIIIIMMPWFPNRGVIYRNDRKGVILND